MQQLESLIKRKQIKADELSAAVAPTEYSSWLQHPLTRSLIARLEGSQLLNILTWDTQLTQETIEKTVLETVRLTAESRIIEENLNLIKTGLAKREESKDGDSGASDNSTSGPGGEG